MENYQINELENISSFHRQYIKPLLPAILMPLNLQQSFGNFETNNNQFIDFIHEPFIEKNIESGNELPPLILSEQSNNKINVKQTKERVNHISRKIIYGNGPENKRLRNFAHFNQPYEHTEVYNLLGKPDKFKLNEIGKKYNEHFGRLISENCLPKFGRNQKRNKSLAVWLFEEYKKYVIPWLQSENYITLS